MFYAFFYDKIALRQLRECLQVHSRLHFAELMTYHQVGG
jgi:hypothetical protein